MSPEFSVRRFKKGWDDHYIGPDIGVSGDGFVDELIWFDRF